MEKENMLRVLKVEPLKHPEVVIIANNLDSLQDAVDGYIEFIYPEDGVVIMVNEEGKINGLRGNRRFYDDILAGVFYVIGDGNDGELTSLPEEKIKQYTELFYEPEYISQEEVESKVDTSVFWF